MLRSEISGLTLYNNKGVLYNNRDSYICTNYQDYNGARRPPAAGKCRLQRTKKCWDKCLGSLDKPRKKEKKIKYRRSGKWPIPYSQGSNLHYVFMTVLSGPLMELWTSYSLLQSWGEQQNPKRNTGWMLTSLHSDVETENASLENICRCSRR